MRVRMFYNLPDDDTTNTDTGSTDSSSGSDTSDDPGRTDTDTVAKKKAE